MKQNQHNQWQNYTEENQDYWTKRAPSYSEVNQEELATTQHQNWLATIEKHIKESFPHTLPSDLKVLDIGTGPGFFAIILAEAGYQVTAIDYTASMLEQAKQNARNANVSIHFIQTHAENPTLSSNTFDVIVTRNVTWNLEHPAKAYQEWLRILKPGGILLNFDANWYRYLYDDVALDNHLIDRKNISEQNADDETDGTDVDAMENIALQAPLSQKMRPEWDKNTLMNLGAECMADEEIWKEVWTENERINNASTPMFLVKARKISSV